jgi:hypothetical protein
MHANGCNVSGTGLNIPTAYHLSCAATKVLTSTLDGRCQVLTSQVVFLPTSKAFSHLATYDLRPVGFDFQPGDLSPGDLSKRNFPAGQILNGRRTGIFG